MKENFKSSLEAVLVHEGGYVNHPRDPGGATNRGVTQATYDGWRSRNHLPHRTVKAINGKEVHAIYEANYWNAVRADLLPSGLDYVVFDGAVNSGPRRSIKWLQRALRVKVDGHIGPETLEAAAGLDDDEVVNVIHRIIDLRMSFLRKLSHWSTFGKGWTSRVNGVRDKALKSASGAFETTVKKPVGFMDLLADFLDSIFRKD